MPENKYVEMICNLAEQPKIELSFPDGYQLSSIEDTNEDELYRCYYAAFLVGDAQFFYHQDDVERREFFNSLCLDEARTETASSVMIMDGNIIGFTLVIPYGEKNGHISCMVVHPDHQRQGLGEFMVQYVIEKTTEMGYRTITLGTDTNMGAFQLYRKNGFIVKE